MDITINARHNKIPESLRKQAEFRFNRLARLEHRLTAATLTFDTDHNARRVEARASVAGGPPIIGHGEGATLRNALDTALDRMERQLKRRRQRKLDSRSRSPRIREDSTVG